jgi:uncharacterized membrane protein YvlD (DUF360 family)
MIGQIAGAAKMIARAVLIWVVEAVSIVILAAVLPGVEVATFRAALAAALGIGLLNAILRPLVLLGAVNLSSFPSS